MDWKTLDSLKFTPAPIFGERTEVLLFWVSSSAGRFKPLYAGPIIGSANRYKDGSIDFTVEGAYGRDCENDFYPDNVTHWAPLPTCPNDEISTGTPGFELGSMPKSA